MNRNKTFLLSILTSFYASSLLATPEFAREQNANCSVCHSNIPMLNETGQSFLRNGFRFSPEDQTTIDNMIKGKQTDGSKHIPLAVMLRESFSSKNHETTEKVKLYAGGTLTKNVSFFGVTQKVYNHQSNSNAPDYFEQKGSRAYFQINMNNDKHVIRVGLLSPFTQFGNIEKSSADSGLKGGGMPQNGSEGQRGNAQGGGYSKRQGYGQGQGGGQGQGHSQGQGNGQGQGQGGSHQAGNFGRTQRYMTPLQTSSFSKFRGAEYSYLYNSKWLFLFSYGKPMEESDQHGQNRSQNNSSSHMGGGYGKNEDLYQFISGIRYQTDGGYKIGIMYNKFKTKRENSFSILVPIEKEFDKFILNSSLLYKNNRNANDYYGMENAITYALNEDMYIRAIFNIDRDENKDHNYGYALSYSAIYKSTALFHITAARKDTPNYDDDLITASVSLLF